MGTGRNSFAHTQVDLPTFHQRFHYCEFRQSPGAEQSVGPLREARTSLRSQRAPASPGFWGSRPEPGGAARSAVNRGRGEGRGRRAKAPAETGSGGRPAWVTAGGCVQGRRGDSVSEASGCTFLWAAHLQPRAGPSRPLWSWATASAGPAGPWGWPEATNWLLQLSILLSFAVYPTLFSTPLNHLYPHSSGNV